MSSQIRNLRNKTVVITGASSGAGRAIAEIFAKEGASLVLGARGIDALYEVADNCELLGARVAVMEIDVTIAADLINLAALAVKFNKQIDIWINNAGVLAVGPFDEIPVQIHDQVIKTNLMGYMYGAHAVIPYFKRQAYGILINNISIGGFLPVPYGVGYSASKFGLRGFSAALKAELSAWKDIHICDTFPAFLDSPGMQHAANYTGKVIQPMPPTLDPIHLAKKILMLAKRPRDSSFIHLTSIGLRFFYLFFPRVTRATSTRLIRSYFKKADNSIKTDGNLYFPAAFGTSISGGWQYMRKAKFASTARVTSFVLSLGILAYLLNRNISK
jgi:short-subunit dehydrogenase